MYVVKICYTFKYFVRKNTTISPEKKMCSLPTIFCKIISTTECMYIRKFKETLTDDLVRVNNALKYWPCIINEGVDTRLMHRYDDVLLLSKL